MSPVHAGVADAADSAAGGRQIGFNNSLTAATFRQSCSFMDVNIATGTPVQVDGDCVLAAVYENWRWWLCVSNSSIERRPPRT